jgi:hypothetical protein
LTLLKLLSVAVITAMLTAFVGFIAALAEEKISANIKGKGKLPFCFIRETLRAGIT